MARSSRVRGVIHAAGALLTLVIAFQLSTGCSSNDKKNPAAPGGGGTTQTTTFVGIFTNATERGKITVTVNTTSLAARIRAARAGEPSVTATATLAPATGSTVSLAGLYDSATDSLKLTGGGYTFLGIYDASNTPPSVYGGYSGPNGMGSFGAIPTTASSSPIEIYLGSFQSDSTNTHGSFNMARYDTLAGVLAFVEGDVEASALDGTVTGTGTTRTVSLQGSSGSFSVTATGTLDTSTHDVSGIWHTYDSDLLKGDDGTWSGSLK
jgi:hypothetical protein